MVIHFILIFIKMTILGECLNTYQFNMLFDKDIGVKTITCIHVRLNDVTTGEHFEFDKRYSGKISISSRGGGVAKAWQF